MDNADKREFKLSPVPVQAIVTSLPEGVQLRRDPILRSFYGISGKIGILGGSFDPVQRAHLDIARQALEKLKLDRVVFIPNYQNPLKERKTGSAQERLDMLVIALQSDPNFFVCPVELEQGKSSFTIDTIEGIKKQVELNTQLYFISGSDCLSELHKWKNIHKLLKEVQFVTMARDDHFSSDEIAARVQGFGSTELMNLQRNSIKIQVDSVSSTHVRDLVSKGKIPYDFLPAGVAEYIEQQKLYGFALK